MALPDLTTVNACLPLRQGEANFVCKGPDNKNLWLSGLCFLNSSILPLWLKRQHGQYVNACAWLCGNKTLFTKIGSEPYLAHGPQCADPWSKELLWGINRMRLLKACCAALANWSSFSSCLLRTHTLISEAGAACKYFQCSVVSRLRASLARNCPCHPSPGLHSAK